MYKFFLWLASLICILPGTAAAHERWILTPDQIIALNKQPKPEIFTTLTPEGVIVFGLFVIAISVLLYMHYFAPNRWLMALSGRTRRYCDYIPTVLRFCAAWTLISSALAFEPRLGTPAMEFPTFLAPDLLLSDLGPNWIWLRWAELILGFWLLLGLWIRPAAMVLALLVGLGVVLFGLGIAFYLPIWLGVCYYLFVRGSGRLALRGPRSRHAFETSEPIRHAQLMLRLTAGLTFIYLGLYFKILQPNLAYGIITIYDVPILKLMPETFVFIMALVEVFGGLLILTGILIRPVSIFLLGAFIFFATCLPETYTAHMLLYGVMVAFILGGPGRLNPQGRYRKTPAPRRHVLKR